MDTSITLDTAKWNCDGAELSSCVITLFYWIMYYNIQNTFGTNLPVDFYPFVLCTYIYIYIYIYMCVCLCVCVCVCVYVSYVL